VKLWKSRCESKLDEKGVALAVKKAAEEIMEKETHPPRLDFLTQGFKNKTFSLGPETKDKVIVGRSGLADLTIDNPMVSNFHCVIERIEEHLYEIKDTNSTNGTYVNGTKIGLEPKEFVNGDVIKLGNVEMIYFDEEVKKTSRETKAVINITEDTDCAVPDIKNMSPFYKSQDKPIVSIVIYAVIGALVIIAVIGIVILAHCLLTS